MTPTSYSYSRYLAAKASVDDRALHPRVWSTFLDHLTASGETLRVLEVGGGVGTTAQRIFHALARRSAGSVDYTMVDKRASNVARARESIPQWAHDNGFEVYGTESRIVLRHPAVEVSLRLVTGDGFSAEVHDHESYDAIIAQAVLDVVPLARAFDAFQRYSHPGTLWYLPIHFNGVTAFEPVVDAELDRTIERLYHDSMWVNDDVDRGGPYTGQRLLQTIRKEGGNLLDAGGSDWIVTPDSDRSYTDNEDYFLYHILHFLEEELEDHADLNRTAFREWMRCRRQQIEDGELTYVAHNIDALGKQ
jgi:hypothetical protein